MGRGKVELKRIENKINRQVTFAKRRNGLLKKAYELSVLCDAEVALIIFSNRGRLYEFCSGSSMAKTVERYQRCSYGTLEVGQPAMETQRCYQEYLKIKSEVEALQRMQRNLLAEELEHLGINDLERLEHQLDSSLKKIRCNKTQHMLDQLSDLQMKEEALLETNRALRRKMDEMSISLQPSWEQNGVCSSHLAPQSDGYFEPAPVPCNSDLQIGYGPAVANEAVAVAAAGTSRQNANDQFTLGWMA
ncbi:hypothetical protein L6164_001904 [Bauhinia variegata]|uniref:Uncharacterized protein n=1 Tax=Bauhinia variegata TaxID=167791 RepID=A0ACB9QB74_BAUVA|nr:hypothetical protein L6164_001904 [Bauhinia variegata]